MKNILGAIYDKMLLAYCHVDILINQAINKVEEDRK